MAIESTGAMAAAKAGDPRAIAALINRSLAVKGITAKVSAKHQSLSVFLEAETLPEKEAIAPFIQKGINSLSLTAIQNVKVYGRCKGNDMPDWQYQFQLDTYVEPPAEVVAVEVVPPRVAKLKTVRAQPSKVSKQKKLKLAINPVVICISVGVGVLLLTTSLWVGLTRSAQSKSLVEAQSLLKEISQVSDSTEMEALQTNRKSLTTNQEKAENAIAILTEAPTLPFWNIGTVNQQLTATEKQIDLIKTKSEEVEKEIATLERLLPMIEEARDSFAALDSSLDVGMSYRDYSSEVRLLKVAIDKLARQESVSDYAAYENLSVAFDHYDFAHDVWKYYIESDENHSFFPASSEYGAVLVNNYAVPTRDIAGTDYIYLNEALTRVWGEAGKHIELAQEKL